MSASRLSTARQTRANATRRASGPLVLDRYRLHRPLGSGGFATVWLARDERLERDVAVKVLPRERIVGGRFEREARAAARLAHPGVVTLYEASVDDDGAYLVSELVRGPTLDQLLESGRLSDQDVVMIGMALCDALMHAHAQGVVHRDVKPSNVLVPDRPSTPAGMAKLTDFGVARVIGGDSLTRTGDVVGTAAYMAPEQAEGREAGVAADLYSLALVIYEALTGVNPVRTSSADRRARRLAIHLPPLRRQRRDLPRELGQGIDLALRPRPRERGSVAELRRALEVAVGQMDDTPGVVTSSWAGFEAREAESRPDARATGSTIADDPEARRARWPARAAAAAAAAVLAWWASAHLLSPSPVAPAAGALLASIAVVALPGIGWLALITAIAGVLVAQGRPGGALAIVLVGLLPVALALREPTRWPLALAAPALGALGLAGAWPAIAGRARTAWHRAALAVTGWVWLALASATVGSDLYTRRPGGAPPSSAWSLSLSETTHHVLAPLLSTGMLAGAAVWGTAAVLLPWVRSRRSPALDVVLVTAWAATTVSATITVVALGAPPAGDPPRTAVLGAVVSAGVALAPALLRRWRSRCEPGHTEPQVP